MNCGDFRYLIQRRFDVELSPPDDRALLIHLETCESCQKFYHQVQQVIIASEEMSLPDELSVSQPQLLANKIFQAIPHYESGILASISRLLSRLSFLQSFKKGSGDVLRRPLKGPVNGDRLRELSGGRIEDWSSMHPERNKESVLTEPANQTEGSAEGRVMGAWGAWSTNEGSDSEQSPVTADLVNRSDTVPLETGSNLADEQRATRSLGEKFSRFVNQSDGIGVNQPLTLAESIRRRIAEMPKPIRAETTDIVASGEAKAIAGTVEDTDSYYDADTFGQWGIPHSPDPPKINSELDLKNNLDKSNQTTAPHSWGKAEGNWGNRVDSLENQSPNLVPDNQKRGGWIDIVSKDTPQEAAPDSTGIGSEAEMAVNEELEESLQQVRHWSQEAEQLETGNWQSVEFDLQQQVAAGGQPLSIKQGTVQQSAQVESYIGVPTETPSVTPQEASTGAPAQLQSQFDLAARLQNVVQTSASGPKIYPVVSKRPQDSSARSNVSVPQVAQPIRQAMTPPVSEIAPPLVSEIVPPAEPPIQPARPSTQLVSEAPTAKEINEKDAQDISSSRLFNLDDPAIDKLFSENLGVHDRSAVASVPPSPPLVSMPPQLPTSSILTPSTPSTVSPPATALPPASSLKPQSLSSTAGKVSSPTPPANTADAGSASQAAPLFAIDDTAIDRIFSHNLGIPKQIDNMPATPISNTSPSTIISPPVSQSQAMPVGPVPASAASVPVVSAPIPLPPAVSKPAPIMPSAPPKATESAVEQSVSRQKITGIDRLDVRAEPTVESGSGRIAAIGKFLLDNKDLEKIGKITASDLSERGMRTLSLEAHKELSNLLKQIDSQVGVIGTMIVGHDGLLIANTIPQDLEAESLSKWAQAIYMGTAQTTEQLGNEKVRQIVSQTERGYLIIANFGAGLLISLTNPLMVDHLLPLMRTITQLVAS